MRAAKTGILLFCHASECLRQSDGTPYESFETHRHLKQVLQHLFVAERGFSMKNQNLSADTERLGIQPPNYRLADQSHVGKVTLAVSSLAASLAFYRDVIGLSVLLQDINTAELGVGAKILLRLVPLPGVQPIGRRARLGLFHAAFLLPSRADLGSFLHHLHRDGVPYGAGDHIYSEALYLTDPDGLTVEVYADRPRSEWKVRGKELLTGTEAVDIAGVLASALHEWNGAPAGTTVGHVHFYVDDLQSASRFYHEALGLTIMTWDFPGALFTSAGGYHHHVGLNVWAAGAPVATSEDARLLFWELVLPTASDVDGAEQSLRSMGWDCRRNKAGALVATDPWGITVHVISR
jgi:catechol 2,3-dioxygenase